MAQCRVRAEPVEGSVHSGTGLEWRLGTECNHGERVVAEMGVGHAQVG